MEIKLQGSLWNSGLIILASLFSDAHGRFTGLSSHTFTSLCRLAYCRSLPALPPARPLPFDIRHIEAHWRERLCPVAIKGQGQNPVTSHSSCATHHPKNTAACHCMHAHPKPLTCLFHLAMSAGDTRSPLVLLLLLLLRRIIPQSLIFMQGHTPPPLQDLHCFLRERRSAH